MDFRIIVIIIKRQSRALGYLYIYLFIYIKYKDYYEEKRDKERKYKMGLIFTVIKDQTNPLKLNQSELIHWIWFEESERMLWSNGDWIER